MRNSTTDVYQAVTDRVIAMLEQGTAPWRQPWTTPDGGPRNIEGHAYRGINVILLSMTAQAAGYQSPFWLTFKQAKERGGSVRKGEHGTMVVFWKRIRVTEKETGEQKIIPLLRHYTVFNVEQTDGVRLPAKVANWKPGEEPESKVEAEQVLANYPNAPRVREGASAAYYIPSLDLIEVPPRNAFQGSIDEFYSTLFHELGHSTGHPTRLNRSQKNGFGTHDYGREELVAEMASAFLCAETGIETTLDNSAAYLNNWIRAIREDTHAVVVAAGQAQRAVDHILGRTFEDHEDNGEQAASTEPEAKAS